MVFTYMLTDTRCLIVIGFWLVLFSKTFRETIRDLGKFLIEDMLLRLETLLRYVITPLVYTGVLSSVVVLATHYYELETTTHVSPYSDILARLFQVLSVLSLGAFAYQLRKKALQIYMWAKPIAIEEWNRPENQGEESAKARRVR